MKTEYRLLPVIYYGVIHYHLQYKYIKKRSRRKFLLFGPIVERQSVSWHDIPQDRWGVGKDDPIKGYGCDKPELVAFTKRWPNVYDYFDDLEKRRQEYRQRKARELSDVKTEYL